MIARTELQLLARERLQEARLLLRAGRFDGAIYLGGYVLELALKDRICRTLKWAAFPQTAKEFASYQSFKTHNLDVLLTLSGVEVRVLSRYLPEWTAVLIWNPEMRYNSPGTVSRADAQKFLDAAAVLMRVLSP